MWKRISTVFTKATRIYNFDDRVWNIVWPFLYASQLQNDLLFTSLAIQRSNDRAYAQAIFTQRLKHCHELAARPKLSRSLLFLDPVRIRNFWLSRRNPVTVFHTIVGPPVLF